MNWPHADRLGLLDLAQVAWFTAFLQRDAAPRAWLLGHEPYPNLALVNWMGFE